MGSDSLIVENCTFSGFGSGCVRVDGIATTGHVIRGCSFTGNHGAAQPASITLNAVSTTEVRSCTFGDGDRGIEFIGSTTSAVRLSIFTDMLQAAVVANSSTGITIEDCRLSRCGHFQTPELWLGPSDQLGAVTYAGSSHNGIIRRTLIEDCGGYTGKNTFVGAGFPKYDGMFAVAVSNSNNMLIEDSWIHRNFFGGIYVDGPIPTLTIQRCNIVQNGERNDLGKDTALYTNGQIITAPNNFWGGPFGPMHDGAGPGNGIDGGGIVTVLPLATTPYVAPSPAFVSLPDVPTAARPLAIIAGDFTNDGKNDFAVAEDLAGTVAVYRNLGGGNFGPRQASFISGRPVGLAVGKFDGDAFLDLAVLDQQNDRAVILFGDGAGNFTPAKTKTVALPRRPVHLRSGNLDGVTQDDLAIACEGDVFAPGGLVWLKNDGTGVFTVNALAGTTIPNDVEILDANTDGQQDIIAFDRGGATPGLRQYLNTGGGTFGAPTNTAVDTPPMIDATLVKCNVDGGSDDLIVADYTLAVPPGVTNIRLFRGTGPSLAAGALLRTELGPVVVRVGAYTAAGEQSVVIVNPGLATVNVCGPVAVNPVPSLAFATTAFGGQYGADAATADISGDGFSDLLVADGGHNVVHVFRGRHSGTFTTFGTGCSGSFGVPVARYNSLPDIGSLSFSVAFEKGFPNTTAALFFGLSPTNVPLPGGCTLYIDPAILVLFANSNPVGNGFIALPIPNNPAFIGGGFYGQWFIVDPAGQVLNLVSATSGFRVVVGG